MASAAQVTPTTVHSVPNNLKDEVGGSLRENVRVAAKTAGLMSELGLPVSSFEMTEEDERAARELFSRFDTKQAGPNVTAKVNPPELYEGNVAMKLSALLSEYDHRVVLDATQARTYITNRLLEISSCGEPKHELKAIELLGKLSDVGAFTDKSEVTVTHRSSDDLKAAIEQKLHRLLNGNVIDVTPVSADPELRDIEKELGLLHDAPNRSKGEDGTASDTDDT